LKNRFSTRDTPLHAGAIKPIFTDETYPTLDHSAANGQTLRSAFLVSQQTPSRTKIVELRMYGLGPLMLLGVGRATMLPGKLFKETIETTLPKSCAHGFKPHLAHGVVSKNRGLSGGQMFTSVIEVKDTTDRLIVAR